MILSASASQSPAAVPACGSRAAARSPAYADQPAVRPGLVVDFPDAGVGFGPPGGDRVCGGDRGCPVVGVEPVGPAGRGEQEERFTEDVELELLVGPVADQVLATRTHDKIYCQGPWQLSAHKQNKHCAGSGTHQCHKVLQKDLLPRRR